MPLKTDDNQIVESKVYVKEFKESWKSSAESVVKIEFPKRILEIDELLMSSQFELKRVSGIETDLNIPEPPMKEASDDVEPPKKRARKSEPGGDAVENGGTNVYAFSNGKVPSNAQISALVDVVKPVVHNAVENINKVKVWILLLIPRIEDGNNFGVGIQEETLSEVRQAEVEAASFLDQISRYYLTRGKIISKLAKYPHVEDYRHAIRDIDEKQFINLRLVLMEIRNHYVSLTNLEATGIRFVRDWLGTILTRF